MNTEPLYVIWSEEHGAWWNEGGSGYTRQLTQAGRYLKVVANKIVSEANSYPTPPLPWSEIAIPDPMVPGPDPLVYDIPHLGQFSFNLQAFTTQGLQGWLSNLLGAAYPKDHPLLLAIQSEIDSRQHPLP